MRAVVLVGGPLDGFEVCIPIGQDYYRAAELDRFPFVPLDPEATVQTHYLVYVLQPDGHTMLFQPIDERRGTRMAEHSSSDPT